MNVALYISSVDAEHGGVHTYELEIMNAIIKNQIRCHHNFIFLKTKNNKKLFDSITDEDIRILDVGSGSLIHLTNQVLKRIRQLLWGFGWPIAFQTPLEKALLRNKISLVLSLNSMALTREIPYALIVYDLQYRLQPYFPEISSNGRWYGKERSYSDSMRRASFIITGTNAGKKEIEKFYQIPSSRICLIPHPTPSFYLNNSVNNTDYIFQKYNLPSIYLFYPAQFWAHKNHAGILAALKHLKDVFNLIIPVVFVGSDAGNLRYIKSLTNRLGLDKQVHFLGFVSREDVYCLYKNALALVYASFFGPENLPPLEAFALGCPVIAGDVSGSEEQLGDDALIFELENPRDLSEKIKLVFENDELRKALIEKGLARFNRFTPDDFVLRLFSRLDAFENIRICWP